MNFIALFLSITSFVALEKPQIKWLTPVAQHAGILKYGQPYTFIFEFEVIGKDSVAIDNIRTDCSCTSPDWQPNDAPTAPSMRRQLYIRYDAARKGNFKKKITVWLHDQRTPERLYISGEVR